MNAVQKFVCQSGSNKSPDQDWWQAAGVCALDAAAVAWFGANCLILYYSAHGLSAEWSDA